MIGVAAIDVPIDDFRRLTMAHKVINKDKGHFKSLPAALIVVLVHMHAVTDWR